MKKKTFIIIAIIIAIFYIILGALLFLDIQVINSPQTTIQVEISEITAEHIKLLSTIDIDNQNNFDLIVEDLVIIAATDTGAELAQITLEGGTIKGNSNHTFISTDTITLSEDLSGDIITTIKGTFGLKFLGIIQKTLPLEITVLVSIQEVLDSISAPIIEFDVEFGNLTTESIEIIPKLTIENPNPISISIEEFQAHIRTDTGNEVGSFSLPTVTIQGDATTSITSSGMIRIEALNAETLYMDLSTEIGAKIAGFKKFINFSTTGTILMPDLEELLPIDQVVELSLYVDMRLSLNGLISNTIVEIENPTELPLMFTDITVDYYSVKGDDKHFITRVDITGGEIPAKSIQSFSGEGKLPILQLLLTPGPGLIPDWFNLRAGANVSVTGLDIQIPLGLNAYIDLHPLRNP